MASLTRQDVRTHACEVTLGTPVAKVLGKFTYVNVIMPESIEKPTDKTKKVPTDNINTDVSKPQGYVVRFVCEFAFYIIDQNSILWVRFQNNNFL